MTFKLIKTFKEKEGSTVFLCVFLSIVPFHPVATKLRNTKIITQKQTCNIKGISQIQHARTQSDETFFLCLHMRTTKLNGLRSIITMEY